jgi:tetratricopeptide (TPR) repeat protein
MLDEVPANYVAEAEFVKTNSDRDTAKVFNYLNDNDPFGNLLDEFLTGIVTDQGGSGFAKLFNKAKSINPKANPVQESFINALGYRLLGRNKTKEAIEIFKFNVEAYPKSGNTYDSPAETYLGIGEKQLALRFYKKALEVEPNYANARVAAETVKKLETDLKLN